MTKPCLMGVITASLIVAGAASGFASERLEVRGIYPGMTIEQLRAQPPLNPNGDVMCSNEPSTENIGLMKDARRRYADNPGLAFCTVISKAMRDQYAIALNTELHTTRADVMIEAIRADGKTIVAIATFIFPAAEHDSMVRAYTAKYGQPSKVADDEVTWNGAEADILTIKRSDRRSGQSMVMIMGLIPYLERQRIIDSYVPPRL